MQSLSAFVMRGRIQAISGVCGFALAPLILWVLLFSSHPLVASFLLSVGSLISTALFALVVLRKGAREGIWVLLLSTVLVGLASVTVQNAPQLGISYGLLLWAPILPLALVLRVTRQLGWALESATALGIAGVLGIYLLAEDPAALWRERFHLDTILRSGPPNVDQDMLANFLGALPHYLTGLMVGSFVVSQMFPLLIARWQQAVLYNPGGFAAEFLGLRFHHGTVYAGLACIGAALFTAGIWAEIAWNLSSLFLVLFMFGGFSILHALLAGKSFWIAGVYVALMLLPQLILPPIVLLGVTDVWFDWRTRSRQTPPN